MITLLHEFISNCIRYLINFNKNLLTHTSNLNKSFISLKEISSSKKFSGGSDNFEELLFGNKFEMLYIGGNHFLLDIESWNLSLKEFKKKFKLNNIQKQSNLLREELIKIKKDNCVKILFENINYDNVDKNSKDQSIKNRETYLNETQAISFTGKR